MTATFPDSPLAVGWRTAAPLVALCGVCGGAGTSTLSLLLARAAVESGHVLLLDTGGLNAGLHLHAGSETSHSVLDIASLLARDRALASSMWSPARVGRYELRVIAARPNIDGDDTPDIVSMLGIVRRDFEHSLVVVDCGTLQRPAELAVARAATHVGWVLPDTNHGLARARRVRTLLNSHLGGREFVVARRDVSAAGVPLSSLAEFAATCGAPLVQVPTLVASEQNPLATVAGSLQAILGVVQR